MLCTRPDICFIVSKLSQFCEKPTTEHWTAVKHVFRYLKGTIDYKLSYCKNVTGLSLVGYTDADWAGSCDRKSTSGLCFKLSNNSLISWKSKKQTSVALSTCEAEYVAVASAIQEALFLKQLFEDMCDVSGVSVTLNCDNQGTISLTKNRIVSQRSKHIDIKYHFIRDVVSKGIVDIIYVPTNCNIADVFTKTVNKFKLDNFKHDLFG